MENVLINYDLTAGLKRDTRRVYAFPQVVTYVDTATRKRAPQDLRFKVRALRHNVHNRVNRAQLLFQMKCIEVKSTKASFASPLCEYEGGI